MKYWDKALTLVKGCTPVSAGCDHCWLRSMQRRFPDTLGKEGEVTFCFEALTKLEKARKTYVWSVWSDLFHKEVRDKTILSCFDVFKFASNQIILVLTKRPERMAWLCRDVKSPNVWLGTSAENQETFDERWEWMSKLHRDNPKQRLFLSAEPLLGPIDFTVKLTHREGVVIIAGPETGPGKRPHNPAWLHDLQMRCMHRRIPFIRKDQPWDGFNATEFWSATNK